MDGNRTGLGKLNKFSLQGLEMDTVGPLQKWLLELKGEIIENWRRQRKGR